MPDLVAESFTLRANIFVMMKLKYTVLDVLQFIFTDTLKGLFTPDILSRHSR